MANKVCEICGRNNLTNMGSHLKQKHDMTVDQYENWKTNKADDKPQDNDVVEEDLKKQIEEQQKIIAELKKRELINKKSEDELPVKNKEEVLPEGDVFSESDGEIVEEEAIIASNDEAFKPEVTPKQLNEMLFDHIERKDPDRPLSEFCEECGISEGELINVVRKYLNIGEIPIKQQIKNNTNIAYKEAEAIANKKPPRTKTTKSQVAQVLEEEFGYRVCDVKSPDPKGGNPKTWTLELVQ